MKTFFLVLSLLSCVACGVTKQVTPTENTRTEIHTETVFVKDTVYISLPQIVMTKETHDTASVIENKYAKSAASVRNGVLVHSLSTKPVNEPVIVDKQIVYRDSLVFVDRINTETIEVEKPLTGWQQVKLALGTIALLAIIAWIVYTIIHFLFTKKLISL